MNKKLRLVALHFFLFSPVFILSLNAFAKVSIYNESIGQKRFNPMPFNYIQTTKLNYEFYTLDEAKNFIKGPLKFYAEMGINQDLKSRNLNIYNDNHVYLSTGLKFFPLNWLFIFSEVRLIEQTNIDQKRSNTDFRLGAIFYQDFVLKNNLYDEHYGELIFATRPDSNILGVYKNKLYYRLQLTKKDHLYLDPFIEGVLNRDRGTYFFNNYQEGRVGGRLRYQVSSTTIDLVSHYTFGFFTDVDKKSRTYNQHYKELRTMIVLYSEF